ncbi:hypothetical protein Vadar_021454 [Vaccinium darrowii]|uniref:Uncharacterized protein n=1 Tax=Vaccinium darrowii TaxID=229202 RepID=A0ACB7XBI7_9ERIC|nr:hypothetical protein Vadar_021454 [Vaccinium darrowii]
MPHVGHAALGFRILNTADQRSVLHFDILPPELCDFGDWANSGNSHNRRCRRICDVVIYMMELQDIRQGPIDDTVLVLQQGHRSRAVWQANGRGPRESDTITIQRCEREFIGSSPVGSYCRVGYTGRIWWPTQHAVHAVRSCIVDSASGAWDDKFHSPDLATHVVGHYRHSLDMQKPDEVIWQPYKDGLIELLPPFCSAGRNIWRAKVPLINFNIIEMHQSERVMRQFGYQQLPPKPSSARDRSHGMEMKKHSHNWAEEHRKNLLRSLISTDLSERVQAVGRHGLMCIVSQEKFLRKEPPVHGVWIPPDVVEEEEVVEDQGNGGVHADEEVGVGTNVEAAEGEQHDGHGHGDDMAAPPHAQQEDHPMPMLHISPGIALSPFFTTPTDVHDGIGSSSQPGSLSESQTPSEDWTDFIVEPIGSGGETSFVDAPMVKRMRLDSPQGDRMQVDAQAEEQILRGELSTLRTLGDGEVEGHDKLPVEVPVEGHDELHVEVPVEGHDQLAAEVQVEVPELRRGTRTRRRPQCGTDSHEGLRNVKHRH